MTRGPDFIGIGAQKAGTTWIYSMLKQHPDVSFGREKEICFFNDFLSELTGINKVRTSNYPKGLSWYYDQLCLDSSKINGEISPEYLYDPVVAKRIHSNFPNVKLVVVLRDPIERAYSQYLFINSKVNIAKNFIDAINKFPELVGRGLYYQCLKRYFDLFPKNNILVLFLEDIKKDPESVLSELESFLGVEYYIPKNICTPVNQTNEIKFVFVTKIFYYIQKVKFTSIGKKIWNNRFFRNFKSKIFPLFVKINSKKKRHKPLKDKIKKLLYPRFKEDIEKLEKLLDKDLSFWKHE